MGPPPGVGGAGKEDQPVRVVSGQGAADAPDYSGPLEVSRQLGRARDLESARQLDGALMRRGGSSSNAKRIATRLGDDPVARTRSSRQARDRRA
jgi:hypothetical protein